MGICAHLAFFSTHTSFFIIDICLDKSSTSRASFKIVIFQCQATCTNITSIDFTNLGFSEPTGDIEVLSGSYLNLTCSNSELFVNDFWTGPIFQLECLHSGEFKTHNPWPSCMEKKACGLPPRHPVNSGLRVLQNVSVQVPDVAVFKCREEGKVTDLGDSIEIQCMIQPGETDAYFVYPPEWGTQGSKCREPVRCKKPFEAPLQSGLKLELKESSYFEFEHAKYK